MTEAKMLGKAASELIGNRQRLMYKNAGKELQNFLSKHHLQECRRTSGCGLVDRRADRPTNGNGDFSMVGFAALCRANDSFELPCIRKWRIDAQKG